MLAVLEVRRTGPELEQVRVQSLRPVTHEYHHVGFVRTHGPRVISSHDVIRCLRGVSQVIKSQVTEEISVQNGSLARQSDYVTRT